LNIFTFLSSSFTERRTNFIHQIYFLFQNSLAPTSCSSSTPLPTDSSKIYSLCGGFGGY